MAESKKFGRFTLDAETLAAAFDDPEELPRILEWVADELRKSPGGCFGLIPDRDGGRAGTRRRDAVG